ncbi:hypothetical protein [Dyadobacter fermentans]|jgi:hypothetical protein|uniref:hypothetical protein n=1 Tax=Dyadobacter fermentans TaxID=94254 RepID=UPI001CBE031B|nr:hypothetical protein [Dyadobacter fermentans]MBZ1359970.1 hypothetical protein [Dyadobacter fermentans]
MKKKTRTTILGAVALSLVQIGVAQNARQWELGISGLTGRNYYEKKYYGQSQLAPGWETNFKSDYLWSAGIWAEKKLNSRFSALAELRYTEEDVPDNMFCECNSLSESPYDDEKLYHGTVEAGLRYYVNPTSKVVFFLDGKANIDWLIGIQETGYRYMDDQVYHEMHWNSYGYKRFSPSVAFLLGAKRKRLSLSFGGIMNIARSTIRDAGTYERIVHPIKTGFFGKGFFVKTSFTLIKLK